MLPNNREQRIGFTCALIAHTLWGIFPLFWRLFNAIDASEVVCHRVLWSFTFLLVGYPLLMRSLEQPLRSHVQAAVRSPSVWKTYAICGMLITVNWLTFLWAVNHNRVLEASLGYYITPLLNVILGVLVLGEFLTSRQWLAVGMAGIGVVIMTIASGGLPWVSLVLACTFAAYGLAKKNAPLPALIGLLLETSCIVGPAIAYLVFIESTRGGVILEGSNSIKLLLVLGGLVTIMPLGLFAFAARRIPLSMIGLLQYIGPTMQFFIGTFIFEELFSRWRMLGFLCVWLALAIYVTSPTPRPAGEAD